MIASDHFTVSFDVRAGTLSVRRRDGRPLLLGAAACANTDVGRHSTVAPGREHTIGTSAFSDRLGAGRRMSIVSRDPDRLLDLRVEIVAYEERPLLTIEVRGTNVSTRDLVVTSLEPVRALADEGGALAMPGVSACLTNGEMFFDAGTVHAFGAQVPAHLQPPLKGVRLANDSVAPGGATVASWWNVGLFAGYEHEGAVLGYLGNTRTLGVVLLARTRESELSMLTESAFAPGGLLRPGDSIDSDRFALCVAATAHAALEQYADAMGVASGGRTRGIVNGWCSWFYTLAEVSEDEVLRNAAFAAEHLKPFGLEYVQIDDGYQRAPGDWQGNERFPHGMRWLAERITELGLKPGLWVAPFVVSEQSEVFREHPEWLVRRRDGSLQRIGNWDSESSPEAQREAAKNYCLDITHPGAANWLRELFATFAQRWGYRMLKVDFMAWSILAAERFGDPALSAAEVYRRGLAIMREAVGEDCHLLECGPGNVTAGLIDSMRIEADINYGYAAAAWRQYFQDRACSAAAAAKRYYFHRRTWVNDVDHLCLDLLPTQQAEAAATLIALAGGNTISGDRLVDMDPGKLEILRKVLPAYGRNAVPVDLFDADIPATFVLQVERPFARWTVAAFFNPDLAAPVERCVALRRLGLEPGRTYLAFDFWRQRLVGEVGDELRVRVAPGSVTLLALHAATGVPQLLSTSRHVAQGALEIEDVRWDAAQRTLHGVSLGPAGSAHDVFVHVPGEHPWTWGGEHGAACDGAGYGVRRVDANVLRVRVGFADAGRVPWRIGPGDLRG
ncbi:MAG TPA: glycoside hydrolase family 36 protein [Gammaproteobacteria bacterium]|jgi:hypothetical protein|nr:glycoside hydrolase family 36 protein [Gammaproteobacteria bacterium]